MSRLIDCLRAAQPLLEQLYRAKGRHYHDLDHIRACLDLFAKVREKFEHHECVETAIWFHDAVYDPKAKDNEERSANLAEQMLQACGVSKAEITRVRELGLATQRASVPTDNDARLLVDIDLAILGTSPQVFDAYERAIRLEYAHVAEAAFKEGRAKILEQFLNRPDIYSTNHFRQEFEATARANLARSLAQLRT